MIEIHEIDDVSVLIIDQNKFGFDFNDGENLETAIKQQTENGFKKFVIDLSNVGNMNSSGLGVLMPLTGRDDLKVILVGVTKKIHNLLMTTKCNECFKCFDTARMAVNFLNNSETVLK